MCASAAILCPDHGFHTSLLLLVLFPVSTFEPRESSSSKLFFLLVTPFSCPYSFCTVLRRHGPLLLPSVSSNSMFPWEPFLLFAPPRSGWHNSYAHLHVVLLESFILLDNREPHIALSPSRFFFSQLLDSCSQVHSKRFHAICQSHSFFLTELVQLILQESTRRNHLALSFLTISVTDNLRASFSTSSFSFFITFFAIAATSFFFPFTKAVILIHRNRPVQIVSKMIVFCLRFDQRAKDCLQHSLSRVRSGILLSASLRSCEIACNAPPSFHHDTRLLRWISLLG